jgi:hypothetical protein
MPQRYVIDIPFPQILHVFSTKDRILIAQCATLSTLSVVTLPQYRCKRHLDLPSVCVYIPLLGKL